MIKINLLPFRAARKKENVRRQISIFALTVIMIGGAIFYFNMHLSSKIATLQKDVERAKEDVKKYEKISAEIAEIKAKLDLLNKKMGVIRDLEQNRKEPAKLLERMTQAIVPNRMWFNSFQDKGDVVSISGTALDNKTVADFMTRLESMKEKDQNLYTRVVVKAVQKLAVKDNADVMKFDVEFTKAKAPTPPQDEKAKN